MNIDLVTDPERPDAIGLVRGWVAAYLTCSRDQGSQDELAAYIDANTSVLVRSEAETLKVLLHGVDYAAQTIRHLLGMCAYVSAQRDGENPQDVDLFLDLREAIWDGTRGLDASERQARAV